MVLKRIDGLCTFFLIQNGSGCDRIERDKMVYYALEKPIRARLNGIPLDMNYLFIDWDSDCIYLGYSESCLDGLLLLMDRFEDLFGSVIDGFDLVESADIESLMLSDSETGISIELRF